MSTFYCARCWKHKPLALRSERRSGTLFWCIPCAESGNQKARKNSGKKAAKFLEGYINWADKK